MIRPLVWQVVWVDELGHGHGTCGHRHADAADATACPWEPDVLPPIGAGLVRRVRDPEYHEPERAYVAGRARIAAARRATAPQLELALEAG